MLRFRPLLWWLGWCAVVRVWAAAPTPPNIVFILVDDLGAADLQSTGAPLAETPAIDRLRTQGLSFSCGYAPAPICSASRASILTGRTPARLHFEFVTKPAGSKAPAGRRLVQPAYPYNLPLAEVSLAELLKPAGYVTGLFGKWHLTEANDRYLGHGTTFGPRQQGFDESSEERGSHPYNYAKPGATPPRDAPAGHYEPDQLTDQAVDFLQRHQHERFFLYFSLYFVHDPVNTHCGWLLDKYRAKAARLGLTGSAADDAHVRYAAFVDIMDHQVGRVLQALDQLGLADNTLVVLTSDNGGHPKFTDNGALRGSKWTLYEGGIREIFMARWPGVVAPGSTCLTPVVATDLFPTFAAVAGAKLPADRPIDGVSLLPLLRNPTAPLPREALIWHFPFYHEPFVNETPASAIRHGRWKLVYHYEDKRTELFDLEADPGEQHDLSADQPARAAALRTELMNTLLAQEARFPHLAGKETKKPAPAQP